MDMNRVFFPKTESRKPKWQVLDAKGQVLGRLATQIADMLRGKNKACYTPHVDMGDYVVVTNAELIELTGNKWEGKEYARYTGYIGGYKIRTAKQMRELHPEDIIMLAVKRMLPKNKLSREVIKKLKVYTGSQHPHKAQIAQ